jgi:excisionase family DNA binding protein
MTTTSEPHAYRPADAARRLGISRSRLYAELRSGALRARKVGGATLIDAEEIKRWLSTLPEWRPEEDR